MLTSRYMTSVKNLPTIMKAIQDGAAPPKFTIAHLKSLGFTSSNDQTIVPLLKDLKFLAPDGTPTRRYQDYRDRTRSKAVMGESLREAYEDLFHVKERPTEADRAAIQGKFKATHNVTDNTAELQTRTFFSLLKLADLDAHAPPRTTTTRQENDKPLEEEKPNDGESHAPKPGSISLRYNIEVHLPATKDAEVYNAIFKSLKEHLLDD